MLDLQAVQRIQTGCQFTSSEKNQRITQLVLVLASWTVQVTDNVLYYAKLELAS
jgi:hypothetical protein